VEPLGRGWRQGAGWAVWCRRSGHGITSLHERDRASEPVAGWVADSGHPAAFGSCSRWSPSVYIRNKKLAIYF